MSDGWLFKLRSNLGSRYVAPSWPSADSRPEPGIGPVDEGHGEPSAIDAASEPNLRAGQQSQD